MFGSPGHHHYVPVLKWKQGEQHALRDLSAATKAQITPLIGFVSVPVDLQTKQAKKTLAAHVSAGVAQIVKHWGTTNVFLDTGELSGIPGAASALFSAASKASIDFVPVTGLTRTTQEIAAAKTHSASGLCLRVTPDDLTNPPLLARAIAAFLTTVSRSPAETDLVIDLGSIEGQSLFVVSAAAKAALAAMPTLVQWRTLTLVATAFPSHMGKVATNSTALFSRTEWLVWKALYTQRSQLARLPTFGDYGIQHPEGVEGYDPRFMGQAAAIRYTAKDKWFIVKGEGKKKIPLAAQFPVLAKKLIASGHYSGQNHCAGSAGVHACAQGRGSFGSPGAWRRVGTTHHVEVVSTDLAGLAYP